MKYINQIKTIIIIFLVLISLSNFIHAGIYSQDVNSPTPMAALPLSGKLDVNPNTGAASYSYPVEVPKGVNGLQPIVSINYNSHTAKSPTGIISSAWTLTENYIERNLETKRGFTRFDNFVLSLNGQQHELVYDESDDRYHTNIETFIHIRKLQGGENENKEYWEIKTKDGTTYRFGYNEDSELIPYSNTMRWSLDLITDTHDNKIYYSYYELVNESMPSFIEQPIFIQPKQRFDGIPYPKSIEYNNDKTHSIEFVYQRKTHGKIQSYHKGWKTEISKQLKEINIKTNNKIMGKYRIQYTPSLGNSNYISAINDFGKIEIQLNKEEIKALDELFDKYPEKKIKIINDQEYRKRLLNKNPEMKNIVQLLMQIRKVDFKYRVVKYEDGEEEEIEENITAEEDNIFEIMQNKDFTQFIGKKENTINEKKSNAGWEKLIFVDKNGKDLGARLADINGDGYIDYVRKDNTLLLIEESGWVGTTGWKLPKEAVFVDKNGKDKGTRLIDLNGDGFADLVKSRIYGEDNYEQKTWLNTGTSWIKSDNFKVPKEAAFIRNYKDYGVRLSDVNADGLPDILISRELHNNKYYSKTYINKGSWWTESNNYNVPKAAAFVDSEHRDRGVRLGDMNGDGLTDIVRAGDCDSSWCRGVWLNTHGGFKKIDYLEVPDEISFYDEEETFIIVENEKGKKYPVSAGDIHKDNGIRLVDINGNGFSDIIKGQDCDHKRCQGIWFNSGRTWGTIKGNYFLKGIVFVNKEGENKGARLADFSADNYIDAVVGRACDYKGCKDHRASMPYPIYQLKLIKNQNGGTTTIDYERSVKYDNTGDDLINDLPNTMWVVKSIEHHNGLMNDKEVKTKTEYSYKDGFYDHIEREFRGFGYVETTNSDGSKVKHHYHQDKAKKGLEYKIEITDKDNKTHTTTENTFSSIEKDDYFIVKLDSSKNYLYDGTIENPIITQTNIEYDEYNNMIKTSSLGDVSKQGDEKYSYTEYSYDTDKWILNTPTKTYLKNSEDSTKVSESYFEYNNYGDLIKSESWLNTGENPTTTYDYDSYGNLISEIDSRGYETKYEYDSTHIFPIKIINVLGQEKIYEYEHGTGNLLSTTDPNGYKTEYKYDEHGRTIKEILPYDSKESPTIEYIYDFDGIAPGIKITKIKDDKNKYRTFYEVFDGLGNKIRDIKEINNTNIKYVVIQNHYDSNGRLESVTNPIIMNDLIIPGIGKANPELDMQKCVMTECNFYCFQNSEEKEEKEKCIQEKCEGNRNLQVCNHFHYIAKEEKDGIGKNRYYSLTDAQEKEIDFTTIIYNDIYGEDLTKMAKIRAHKWGTNEYELISSEKTYLPSEERYEKGGHHIINKLNKEHFTKRYFQTLIKLNMLFLMNDIEVKFRYSDYLLKDLSSKPKTTYVYDAYGRNIKTIKPDGTETRTIYNRDTTSIYDENDHRTDYIKDVYGNIIEVKEYNNNEI